jgi:indole-3-glycerol phosphate synthase
MSNILSSIIENKKKRIKILKKNEQGFLSLIKKAPKVQPFRKAITKKNKISLIAEIKQASPSAGVLRPDFSLEKIASLFSRNNVDAISVLTEEDFFLGKISYIKKVKEINPHIPVLRKDFIIDPIQILEARAAGADAVLLILRLLDVPKLKKLYDLAKELGMDVIVEVHSEKELRKILPLSFDIIGINNRNLNTLKVSLGTTAKLAPFISKDVTIVSESGINNLKDVLWLKGIGVDAVLIGEAFMKSISIKDKIQELHVDG